MDKDKELTIKALEIGIKYRRADRSTRIKIGTYMTKEEVMFYKKIVKIESDKNEKELMNTGNIHKQ